MRFIKRPVVRSAMIIRALFCSALVYGQAPEFKFEHIGVKEGLSQVSVRCILQDHENYMWFGTDYGLNKYDGYKITTYKNDLRQSGTISSNNIVCMYEDSHNNLWVGTLVGLNRYDRTKDQFISYKNDPSDSTSLSENGIKSIFENNDGLLWISTFDVLTNRGSLNVYDQNNGFIRHPIEHQNFLQGIGDQMVNCIYEELDGNLWLGLSNGLSYFEKDKNLFTHYRSTFDKSTKSIHGKSVNDIVNDQKGNLWIATDDGGISVLNKLSRTFKHYNYDSKNINGLGNNQVYSLLADQSGRIWAAVSDGGLHLYNPERDNFFHYNNDKNDPNSISQDFVRALFQDKEGIIWIGIYKSGVNFLLQQEGYIKHFKKGSVNYGLSANKVKSFCQSKNGAIWIASDGGGLNQFDQNTGSFHSFKTSKKPSSIGSDLVLDVLEDSYENLWVGTWDGGLNLLNRKTNTFDHFYHDPKDATTLSSNNVWCIVEDHHRNLWVATFSEGLNLYNRETNSFKLIPCFLKNEKSRIVCMSVDSEGMIWVGTNSSGIGVLDPKTHKFVRQYHFEISQKHSISSNGISEIFVDTKGRVWIGSDMGLNLYNPSTDDFTTWQTSDGLIHDVVAGIVEDGAGNLWISTLGGITKFRPETRQFSNYSVLDDLNENKFLESSCLRAQNGELYFGGINGFNVFHPDSIAKNRFVPPVHITDFMIFNKSVKYYDENSPLTRPISATEHLILSYKQSVISFEFAALNYTNTEKNQYAYQLVGFDKEWNYIGTKRSATYTNLNPGDYVLKVKASNDDGVWNEVGTSLNITINPPFWKTWWAYMIYFLLGGFALYIYREYSIIHIKERNRLFIEQLENKKIAEISEAKMRFFTNISHEIRTPLTLISSPLENVLTEEKLTPPAAKNLHSVNKNVKRLLSLVNQLLQFRKLDMGFLHLNASETSISTLLEELLEYFEQHASLKNIDIILDNQLEEEKNLWLDREMITTVFYNLLANAIKYTPSGGHIYITIFEGSKPPSNLVEQIKIWTSSTKRINSIAVDVSDTGKGIALSELKNIFRRFYQVQNSTNMNSGSGLGLSLVKEYVELHKGQIEVHSKIQQGTSFTIYFPKELKIEKRKTEQPEESSTLDSYLPIAHYQSEETDDQKVLSLVLVVEDDPELLQFVSESLRKSFRVETAENGKIGLKKAMTLFPNLIISDIAMPEMDGYQLCKEVKSNIAINHIPVILLTAKASDDDIVMGYEFGADAYIPKPFNIKVLESQGKALIKSREKLREKYKNLLLIEPTEIEVTSPDEKFLKQLMEVTESRIDKTNFDVNTLVEEMGMSRSALFRKVKSLTGISIVDFIKTTRLKRAAMLFRKEKLSVSEVCYKVGFSELSYFSKCFAKEYGKTPSEYSKAFNSILF